MRRLLRDVAEKRTLGDTTTLADPAVVEEIKERATADAARTRARLGEQLLEAAGIVERPDHREIHSLFPDQVLRDATDVLGGHLADRLEDLLRIGRPALQAPRGAART